MEPNRQKSVAVSVEKQKPRGRTGYVAAVCLGLAPQAPRFLHSFASTSPDIQRPRLRHGRAAVGPRTAISRSPHNVSKIRLLKPRKLPIGRTR
jgi:hypothetical protein